MSLDVDLIINTCAVCGRGENVYSANITHNLGAMAREAGIYGIVWRPEESGIATSGQMVQPLTDAIKWMVDEPDRFIALNLSNGWGSYDDFLPWLERYRDACKLNPNAIVRVSR